VSLFVLQHGIDEKTHSIVMNIRAKKFAHSVLFATFLTEGIFSVALGALYLRGDFNPPPSAPFVLPATSSSLTTGVPMTLRIPAIDVDAKIESVGLNPDGSGELGVPSNFTNVAWYNEGPHPGMEGTAVIDGHRSGKYLPHAVFHDLHLLKSHDVVEVVDEEGTVMQFEVVEVKTYEHDAPTNEVFTVRPGRPRLNLITCAGDWVEDAQIFDKRTVVFTELIGTVDPRSEE
jgi:sortase (surface protein transpeptidase)